MTTVSTVRQLVFFSVVFTGAIMADQHQYDTYEFSNKEQQAFDELFKQDSKEQEDERTSQNQQ